MAERFSRLYELQNNLYSDGAPVIVSAGALLKDTQTNNIIVQLKFHSVSATPIKALKVGITAFDIAGKEVEGVSEYQYLDLSIKNGQEFGSNKAIVMPDSVIRSFAIKGITVVAADGCVKSISMPLVSLPHSVGLQSALKDVELIKQYKLKTSNSAAWVPQEANGLWQCHCGEWNCGSICSNCGGQKSVAFAALDLPALTDEMNARLAEEKQRKAEAEQRAEAERQEKAKQLAITEAHRKAVAKKTKKILAVVFPILVLVITFSGWIYPQMIKPSMKYKDAVELLSSGQYDVAAAAFSELGDYKDSQKMVLESQYQKAQLLMTEGQHTEAARIFSDLSGYRDSDVKANEIYAMQCSAQYAEAEALLLSGQNYRAAVAFGKLGDYEDAKDRSRSLWATIVSDCTLSVGYEHSVAIKANGDVLAIGSNEFGQCDVEDWSNIVSVSAGWDYSVGLRSDGTVIATGKLNEYVRGWQNIVAVAAGGEHIVGLKSDGTVIAVGENLDGQCNVEEWSDIISISAGQKHTVGIHADGTVVATGHNYNGQCNVEKWKDIVFVSANMYRTVGVKSNGTVVAIGDNDHGQCNVEDWEDIVSVASARAVTFGLKRDGTVVACGYNYKNVCEIDDWRDIVAIATNGDTVTGVTSGGYLVEKGIFRHAGWSNIRITDSMEKSVNTLSSKISDLDFGPEGYIEFYLKVENDPNNSGTNLLKIYKNGAVSLKRVEFRGNGIGPSTRFFLDEEKNIAKWDAETRTFALNITDKIICTIEVSENGAWLKLTGSEQDLGIEGWYTLG